MGAVPHPGAATPAASAPSPPIGQRATPTPPPAPVPREWFPSAAQVVVDMRTASERDSAARAYAALKWLGTLSAGALDYDAQAQVVMQAERAKYGNEDNGFGDCQRFYYFSAPFVRTVVDKYFSVEQQARIRVGGTLGEAERAIAPGTAMPPNPPAVAHTCADDPAASARRAAAVEAVKRKKEANEQAARNAEVAAAANTVREAAEATSQAAEQSKEDEAASGASAEDLRSAAGAKRKVDMTVFGAIKMGRPLAVADCVKTNVQGLFGTSSGVDHASLRGACKEMGEDGATASVHFPATKLPTWIGTANGLGALEAVMGDGSFVHVVLQSGVVVEVWMRANETDELGEDLTSKYGPAHVRQVSFSNSYGSKWEASQYEWKLPGLHVEFVLDETQSQNLGRAGMLTIELDSRYKSTRARQTQEKAKHLKL
jgi:hypothetical protein